MTESEKQKKWLDIFTKIWRIEEMLKQLNEEVLQMRREMEIGG